MARYLVTGGAGFIGSHLVKELVDQGHQVTVLDNLSTGSEDNLEGYLDKIRFIRGDICDRSSVQLAGEGAEYIFHLAALISVSQSMSDPLLTFQVNCLGTLNVLTLARHEHVKRVIFSSSSAVYGEYDNDRLAEDTMPQPISPYGLSKLMGEQLCQHFSDIFDVPTISLRYFNVFGPRQVVLTNYGAVIPQFITTLLAKRLPTIYGDGEQTRDFVHVHDVVAANLAATQLPKSTKAMVINIAYGKPTSINTLYQMIRDLISEETRAKYSPWRAGEVHNSVADISRAREVLGYEPKVTLEEGLKQTVEWYRGKE